MGPDRHETQSGYYLTGQVVAANDSTVGNAYMRSLQEILGAPASGISQTQLASACLRVAASAEAGAFLISLGKMSFSTSSRVRPLLRNSFYRNHCFRYHLCDFTLLCNFQSCQDQHPIKLFINLAVFYRIDSRGIAQKA